MNIKEIDAGVVVKKFVVPEVRKFLRRFPTLRVTYFYRLWGREFRNQLIYSSKRTWGRAVGQMACDTYLAIKISNPVATQKEF